MISVKSRSCTSYKQGRLFLAKLVRDDELLSCVKDIVTESAIQTARFSFTGAVSKYTIGTYDPGQQVYVTFSNTSFREVTECCGNISLNEGKPHVFGSIVLCDQQGAVEGGRLFSETIVYAGEIIIEELLGPPLKRLYDPDTGLVL